MAEAAVNIKVLPVGTTALEVTWDPAPTGTLIVSYSYAVFCRKAEDAAAKFALLYQTKDDFEFLVEDLEQNTEYVMYIQSFSVEAGDCSAHVTTKTAMDAPELPPRNLTVTKELAEKIVVQWEPPEELGGVTGYKLFIDREGEDDFEEIEFALAECSYSFLPEDMDTVFRFQVICFGEGGEGPETPILRWQGSKADSADDDGADGGGSDDDDGGGAATVATVEPTAKPTAKAKSYSSPEKDLDAAASISGRGTPPATRKIGKAPVDLAKRAVAGSVAQSSALSASKLLDLKAKVEAKEAAKYEAKEKKEYPAAKKWPAMITTTAGDDATGAKTAKGVSFGVRMRPKGPGGRQRPGDRVSYVMTSRSRTIRGKKGGVRKAKGVMKAMAEETLKEDTPLERTLKEEIEKDRLVLYMTSVGTVRQTYINCEKIKQMLYNLRINVFLKNVALDKRYIAELEERLPGAILPQLFGAGEHIGDFETIFSMNERAELTGALVGYAVSSMSDCEGCGGTGFIVCQWCRGSGRSIPIANSFEEAGKGHFLKCTACNENNLMRCQSC